MGACPFPKSRGCSATGRLVYSPTPTNAGLARRREKHARPRKDWPRLSHPIGGDCRDDVRPAVDFTSKPPFRFTEQDREAFELAVKLSRIAVMASQSCNDDGQGTRPM